MGLVSNPKRKDDVSVRQAIARLGSSKLGPTSSPTFADVTTGGLTISDLDASEFVFTNASKELVSVNVPLTVPYGGTGVATFTDHSILLGSGVDVVTALGLAANGQIPIGFQNSDPVLANITQTANQVLVANGAGTITLSLPQDYDTGATPTLGGLTSTGTIDATGGEVLVEDNATTEPKSETDGYVGVAEVAGNSRIYFSVEGNTYYIDGTLAPATGSSIGLLLTLTYS